MWWAFAAIGGIGLVLGIWFRVPALVAASGLTAAACLSLTPLTDLGPMAAVVITFATLAVLQLGYLVGLILSCAWSSARLSLANLPMLGNGEKLNRRKPWGR
jgi:hypothetical protein